MPTIRFTLFRLLQPTFISLLLCSAETCPCCQQRCAGLKCGIGSLTQNSQYSVDNATPACQNITTFVLWQKLLTTATSGTNNNSIRSLEGPFSPYSNLICFWSPLKRSRPALPHPQWHCLCVRWRDRHLPWGHCSDLSPSRAPWSDAREGKTCWKQDSDTIPCTPAGWAFPTLGCSSANDHCPICCAGTIAGKQLVALTWVKKIASSFLFFFF